MLLPIVSPAFILMMNFIKHMKAVQNLLVREQVGRQEMHVVVYDLEIFCHDIPLDKNVGESGFG